MNPDDDAKNWVPATETSQGVAPVSVSQQDSPENWVAAEGDSKGITAYDEFRAFKPVEKENVPSTPDRASDGTPKPKEGQSKGVPRETVQVPTEYPDEGWLNATIHTAQGAAWNMVAKPILGMKDPDVDKYLSDIERQHPIASTIGGTTPYIASSFLFPESLIPHLYGRMAVQFGAVAGLSAVGHERVDEAMKPLPEKALAVAEQTAKGAAFSPIWAKAQELQFIGRPFATALAKAGIIGAGSSTLSTFFGDNITEAFKQGGILTALSLISEGPHLGKTVIGRGIVNHANTIYADMAVKAGLPITKMEPESPVFTDQVVEVTKGLAKQIKGIDKPQIVSATVKLSDGTEIHGASHEDALNKIGQTKDTFKEYKEIPDVSLEDKPNSNSVKNVKNKDGQIIGDIAWAKDKEDPSKVSEEGIDIDVKAGKGYGRGTINQVFNKGIEFIQGDVSKTNTQAIKFWQNIGGKLTEQGPSSLKLHLSKEDFLKATGKEGKYEAGFTVREPNGKSRFITNDQAKEEFGITDSKDVPGLNESKFMPEPEPLKIVNTATIEQIKGLHGEAGAMDVNMIPGVAEAAEMLQRTHTELTEKLTPYTVGQEGQTTAATIRENLGILARSNDMTEHALSNAKKVFDKADKESSLDFIHKMETGEKQSDPSLEKVAHTLRTMLDTKRDEIRALGTGKLENFIENYFPHVWESPNKAMDVIKSVMGRRPFEGSKSFLKKRTIPTTREGIELGLTPISYNPIDSVMLKVREMDRYLMAHRSINALKEQGLIKFVRDGEQAPEGFVKIDDRFAEVKYKNDAKETVVAGKYMAQKDAARILNNYLSPGLAGKSYLYDMYRGAGNTLNQFQLGISAFHLGFTSMDATISKFALGINRLSVGDYAGAIKEFGKAPFSPITNIMQGRELLQAWYGKDMGPLTNTIAEVMASAGGRAKMDKFYATGAKESMQKALKEGKILTGAMKVPYYIVEQVARPIMEYIVPRQKMGVFMDLMKMEMERNPNMSHDQMRSVAQRAWDSVDNRMGQVVYDNLFWNRTVKDLGMASVRSLGWNLGTIREIGGGTKDVIGNVQDLIHGKATKLSYRTAYVMALPIVTGLYGAIYQYLHTGQGPQELKDYFFPKNGAIDTKGQAARVSLPTYMKDIYHYTQNPVQTVLNKFSPVNNAVIEMIANKDFYGTEIRNADDPIMQQVLDEAKFLGTQFIPFGFRNQKRDTRTSAGSKVEPFIGITPAPYDINMTKAEREASDLNKGHIPVGSRTKEQAAHSQAKSKLRSDFMASKDIEPLNQAVSDKTITPKEKREIIKESKMSNLERLTRHSTFEEVVRIMKKATEEERPVLERILNKKRQGKQQRGTWTRAEEEMYDKSFDSKE